MTHRTTEGTDALVETVTRAFHDAYERRAGEFNYETRGWKRWEDVPPENQALMRAVVAEATRPLSDIIEGQTDRADVLEELARIQRERAEAAEARIEELEKERDTALKLLDGHIEQRLTLQRCKAALESLVVAHAADMPKTHDTALEHVRAFLSQPTEER